MKLWKNQGSFSLRQRYRRETESMATEARSSTTDASIVAYWSNQTETSEFVFRDLKKWQLEDPDGMRIVLDFFSRVPAFFHAVGH